MTLTLASTLCSLNLFSVFVNCNVDATFVGSRPNFDNRSGPPFDMPHNPYKWHGHMGHPNPEADGPMNHDQSTPLLPNPEPMPPFHPGQGFPMGPQQGPPGGPRGGPMQGGPLRGGMPPPGPGPHNRMMHGMSNPMQSQSQRGMMPPPRPPLINQPMRGPLGPPGPGGPRPLLSLPFQDRDIPPGLNSFCVLFFSSFNELVGKNL